jgi:putative intracellular protease/amidase
MAAGKTIGFVFIPRFADWEYGLLAASAVEWFGARAVSLTPDGEEVTGSSGFRLMPDRAINSEANDDLEAVAVIGSDEWTSANPPDVSTLIRSVAARGGVVGGICAGTLALARAGLLEGQRHTSNGRDWILQNVPGYAGSELYQDVPHAVAGNRIVTAPGSAPGTFAKVFLETLYPEQKAQLAEMAAIFAKEHGHSFETGS